MTDARAISVQLVDIRNVDTHKVVKLTLHAPQEQALKLTELFGWPTGVNPVPVALARMEVMPNQQSNNDTPAIQPQREVTQSVASSVPAGAKSPAQIAGY